MQFCATPNASILLKAVSLPQIGVFGWKGTLKYTSFVKVFKVPFQQKTPILGSDTALSNVEASGVTQHCILCFLHNLYILNLISK